MPLEKIPALVAAGGRIGGEYAQAAGTTIKALVEVSGRPMIGYALQALGECPAIGQICVVGPKELRPLLDKGRSWEADTGTAVGNVFAGIRRLGEPSRLLLLGSDLPMVTAPALEDFVARAPKDCDIALPIVSKEDYLARFPDGRDEFARLADGRFTAGSQFLVRPEPVLRNRALIERLFNSRKSQAGMAMAIGLPTLAKFLAGRLSVADVEKKLSALTGCVCRAVPFCRPELAFDIDGLPDLQYAERWKAVNAPERDTA